MLQQPKLVEVVKTVLKDQGLDYLEAMTIFKDFLITYYKQFQGDIVLAGDHIGEYAPWINTYLSMCDYEPLHMIFGELKHPIDIHSYHQGCSRKTHKYVREFANNGKKFSANIAAFKHFNIKDWNPMNYTHNALDNSYCIAMTYFKILKTIEFLDNAYSFSPKRIY